MHNTPAIHTDGSINNILFLLAKIYSSAVGQRSTAGFRSIHWEGKEISCPIVCICICEQICPIPVAYVAMFNVITVCTQ